MLFDLRGKPGFHRFPLRIGQDVQLLTGGPVMTIVDFDENGDVVAAWRSASGEVSEMRANHGMFIPWRERT